MHLKSFASYLKFWGFFAFAFHLQASAKRLWNKARRKFCSDSRLHYEQIMNQTFSSTRSCARWTALLHLDNLSWPTPTRPFINAHSEANDVERPANYWKYPAQIRLPFSSPPPIPFLRRDKGSTMARLQNQHRLWLR